MHKLHALLRFVSRIWRRFIADACAGRAAGLAFSTLFALVPLTAFVVAVLTTFGAFDPLIRGAQEALIEQLVPAVHEEVFAGIGEFASNTRALGFFGLFIFLATAVLLLQNIHTSLNAIWQYRSRRGIWGTVASYTSVIVIGTTLLSASFVVGPVVQSVMASAFPEMAQARWLRTFLLPPLFLFLTVFSINVLVPAGKVSAASAALGAGVTVIIWEAAKRIFVFWSTSVMRLNVIYGSLAVLPIFLIWLYLSWLFVLIGVEVAYAFHHRHDEHHVSERPGPQPVSVLVELCAQTALEVIRRHRDGAARMTVEELDSRLGADSADAVRVGLEATGLILATDHGLLPSRRIDGITVGELLTAILAGPPGGTTGEGRQSDALQSEPGHVAAAASNAAPAVALTAGGTENGTTVRRLISLWHAEPNLAVASDRVLQPAACDSS